MRGRLIPAKCGACRQHDSSLLVLTWVPGLVVLVRCLHCRVTPHPSSHAVPLWKEVTRAQPTLKPPLIPSSWLPFARLAVAGKEAKPLRWCPQALMGAREGG